MANDDRSKELQDLHNRGQTDAANHEYHPPHDFIGQNLNIIGGNEKGMEESKAYSECFSHTWDQTHSDCYLTTACTMARGLPDDCLELTTLRAFRDAILLRNPSGRREVADYYKAAPRIVAAIEADKNSSSMWNKVYGDVRIAVDLVRRGRYQEAFEHYKKMTLRLKEAHL